MKQFRPGEMVLTNGGNWLSLFDETPLPVKSGRKGLRSKSIDKISLGCIYLFWVFIEDLELHKIDSLLEEIYISKVFDVQKEFCNGSKRHSALFIILNLRIKFNISIRV